MSDGLPLPSFEVTGFRGIRHLRIPGLKRVNLVVGLNNSGKTALLEGMRLFLHRRHSALAALIAQVVRSHTDFRPPFARLGRNEEVEAGQIAAVLAAADTLFYDTTSGVSYVITLGPADDPDRSNSLELWHPGSSEESRRFHIDLENPAASGFFSLDDAVLRVQRDEQDSFTIPVEWFLRRIPLPSAGSPRVVFIPATGFDSPLIANMWDRVQVAGQQDLVEAALRNVVPDLERIVVVGGGAQRSILLKTRKLGRPAPLRSMGDGVVRVFSFALALVVAQNGIVLIDEVENGLHYSVQDQVWEAIFRLSAELNVQVVATTHSWDALVGFQWAASKLGEEGILYRLDREDGGEIRAVAFTEHEVAIAADQRIEVR